MLKSKFSTDVYIHLNIKEYFLLNKSFQQMLLLFFLGCFIYAAMQFFLIGKHFCSTIKQDLNYDIHFWLLHVKVGNISTDN